MSSNIIYDNDEHILKLDAMRNTLLKITAVVSASFAGTTLIAGILIILNTYNQVVDSKTASVKEGNILKTELTTEYSKNIQKNKIKNVVIDANNNGIEDADDVVINGKFFTFSEVKEGRNVVFLQSKRRLRPLAVENINGKFDIKKSPSGIYNLLNSETLETVKKLDAEFNNIVAQKSR